MQINELMQNIQAGTMRGADSANFSGEGIQKSTNGASIDTSTLREIKMDSPFYSKHSLKDEMEKASVGGAENQTEIVKNQMVLASQTMSGADLKEIEEQGLNAKEMDPEAYTTIADQIKLQLAKAGVDISSMGGLSQDQIEAISGNADYAVAMENALKAADLPVTEEVVQDGVIGMQKIDEMSSGNISKDAMEYLVRNAMPATVENVYTAVFAGNDTAPKALDQSEDIENMPKSLEEQIQKVMENAGVEVTDASLMEAKELCVKGIPMTEETFAYLEKLQNAVIPEQGMDAVQAMVDAVAEGKMPQEMSLIPGESLMDQARTAVETIQEMEVDPQDLSNYRALEELRLTMTVQASFRLLKSGVEIDTKDLSKLVDDLKAQEESYARVMLGEDAETAEIEAFVRVEKTVSDIQEMPAVLLGRIPDMETATFDEIHTVGIDVRTRFQEMNQTYEAVGTEVRRDLGDSIQKAFRNVDTILEDLGEEITEENQRAVRILAYNETEITTENLETMKAGDQLVQATLKHLTPAVVAKMIQNGENPLDVGIKELNERAIEIQGDLETSDQKDQVTRNAAEERYSKFLWKLDQSSELSESERTSFIGVFRLIHQVNASDGAAIGMLINQGQDVTLKNLLTAVRSRKSEQQEFTIDDEFGYRESVTRESMTITEQIESSFTAEMSATFTKEKQASLLAERELSPYKLQQLESTDEVMEMAPSQLADALTGMEEPVEIEQQYYREKAVEIRRAVQSESQVYQLLDQFDIPQTPANLSAMQELLYDRNSAYRTLNDAAKKRKVDRQIAEGIEEFLDLSGLDFLSELDDIIQNSLEEFGEACKTPEAMAEAQENLADRAENVMRNALLQDGVASLDLKALQRMYAQTGIFSDMAKTETYHIPIMVADQAGNMTLKIVRGEEQKGLVDIALDMNALGRIRAAFRCDGETVSGTISTDSNATRTALSEQAGAFASAMQQETGMGVSFQFGWTREVDINSIYQQENKMELPLKQEEGKEEETDRAQVQTKVLYGVARSFIEMFQEVLA